MAKAGSWLNNDAIQDRFVWKHVIVYDCVIYNNMVEWISARITMPFRARYDTFWPCGLFTLLKFCNRPPSKKAWNSDE